MDNVCILCGIMVPEGRMICPHCENDLSEAEKQYEQTLSEKKEAASAHPKWRFWRKKAKTKRDGYK